MMEIGFAVIFTTFAGTVGHEGSEVVGEFGVFNVNAAIFRIEGAVTCHAGGTDTVESIDAEFGAHK